MKTLDLDHDLKIVSITFQRNSLDSNCVETKEQSRGSGE